MEENLTIESKAYRIKRVEVQPEALMHILTQRDSEFSLKVIEGIPKTAKFAGWSQNWTINSLNIFFEDDSFDLVEAGVEVPLLKVNMAINKEGVKDEN